jgi:hypothetical protein
MNGQAIFNAPDIRTRSGIRDRAMLHVCFAAWPSSIGIDRSFANRSNPAANTDTPCHW